MKVILDCDNTMGLPLKEVDDGLTVLYLLGRPDIELIGVTTTFGNGTIDEAYPQTVRLLRRLGRGDMPVLRGAGARGDWDTEAARYLADTAAKHPGEITLLATGTLGNLGAAARLDRGFFGRVKQILCMGGYLRSLRLGWRDVGELNLSGDPEATHAVLRAGCPVTVMNAHVCLQAAFGYRDLWRIRGWDRDLRKAIVGWLLTFGAFTGLPRFYLWDLLPAVYISHRELFDESRVMCSSSARDLETGSLILDGEGAGEVNMPTRILDRARFREILFEAWSQAACSS